MKRPDGNPQFESWPHSASNTEKNDSPKPALELEPLKVSHTPRHVEQVNQGLGTIAPEVPVPAHPLHLCPNCDYNLTGLRSRRCPECGEPFALPDARLRGFETTEDMKGLIRSDRWAGGRKSIGIALMVISFATINWVRVNPITGWGLYQGGVFSFRGVLCLNLAICLLAIGGIIRFYFEFKWADVFLVVGIVLASIALVSLL